ncbi:dsDNA nuclease domain-containing protein [Enterovibrio nigricans]|uniref:CD-NTase associated protein 4-like DNA endonuclease domain-containing protein n=1 Tax=Enterovibrio nigricans DSM 22720 TaxID=1121868 RepID=A0A1T4VJ49_9GAMM|nr:dsDNA nuclease domain-containing protein [Enterovibrio nigricans]PKF49730.1 hypothetical protein AT251_16800 [Enterovibrio nigricans]SKA64994.1 protein of unknown function [Enterovibrio nigricans DSM 22720]
MYQMDENNSGGVGAKAGFYFQDHVATLLASEMLLDNRVRGIGCEVGDDIDVFHSDDSVTHVQVKTGTVDKDWNLTQLRAPRNSGAVKDPNSSILHKSLELDKDPTVTSKFMLVTDKPVASSLSFLEIPLDKRSLKTGRDALVKSIDLGLKNGFKSGNGNGGGYWVDNTIWRVFSDIEFVILKVEHNLRSACEELLNCTLSNEGIRQLGEILCNRIYAKSQISKKTGDVVDKTLTRDEAQSLLRQFATNNTLAPKAYSNKNLPEIVTPLFEESEDKRRKRGFTQGFNFGAYRYDHVVDMLIDWVDEVFLRPSEIVGGSQTFGKAQEIRERIAGLDLKTVTARTILNSILRKQNQQSQPIPMVMFAANGNKCLKFDSVHIVLGEQNINELWVGVTEFIENSDVIFDVMQRLSDKISDLIFLDMDKDRRIILEAKDDKYLFKHDIDSILDTSSSFESNLERFKFVVFISYKMDSYDHLTSESDLMTDIKNKIDHMYNLMVSKNPFFAQVRLGFYVFPTPCNDTILNKLKDKISL